MTEHNEHEGMDPAAALAQAEHLTAAVRSGTRWYVRYQLVFGIATAAAVFTIGVLNSDLGIAIVMPIWLLIIMALSVSAARRSVADRGFGRRHGIMIAASMLLGIAVLSIGDTWLRGELAWWLPGAVATGAPGLVGAYLQARR